MSAPQQDDEQGRCSRLDWCSGRTIEIHAGERIVIPAATPRAYCHACESHITLCLEGAEDPVTGADNGMAALWARLHAELGEARQSEVMVKMAFGPSLPLSEAIDAQMRNMGWVLSTWEDVVRDVWHMSAIPKDVASRPQDSLADIERSVTVLVPRISTLLSLQPRDMMRYPDRRRPPKDRDIPPGLYDDAIVLSADRFTITAAWEAGGLAAGQEILHLHYMARRLLLETNPPMPRLPDFRCRVCECFTLRRAAPPWYADGIWYHSACDSCGDEMTRDEYDTNAKRWLAWERAHQERPTLAQLNAPAAS